MISNKYLIPFLFSLLLIVVSCHSQKTDEVIYDMLIEKAKKDFESKKFVSALNHFEKAFYTIPYRDKNDYFYAAASAFHIKENKKATNLIISCIKNMNVYEYNLLNFIGFEPFMDNDFFMDIKYKFPEMMEKIGSKSGDPNIEKEIDSLIMEDQKVRKTNSIFKKHGRRIDSLNINRVIQLTQEYGWHSKMWLLL